MEATPESAERVARGSMPVGVDRLLKSVVPQTSAFQDRLGFTPRRCRQSAPSRERCRHAMVVGSVVVRLPGVPADGGNAGICGTGCAGGYARRIPWSREAHGPAGFRVPASPRIHSEPMPPNRAKSRALSTRDGGRERGSSLAMSARRWRHRRNLRNGLRGGPSPSESIDS